jgi:hypothetical protein
MAKSKRKWSNLKGVLPDAPVEAPTGYEQEMAKHHEAMDREGITDLGRLLPHLNELEAEKERLEQETKKQNARIAAAEGRALALLKKDNLDSVTHEGQLFYTSSEPHPKVTDHLAVRDWARENGHDDSLQLPWSTLKALVKERLGSGEPVTIDEATGDVIVVPGTASYMRTTLRARKA